MRFVFEAVNSLPLMAWCLRIESGRSEIRVFHGSGVDHSENLFYEGCWDGDLTSAALFDADICAATGAFINDGRLFLATPSDTLARIYAIRQPDQLWFSNSMAFLVAASNEALREDYIFYQDDISSVIDGLQNSIKSIPLQSGQRLDFYFHCNLEVSQELDVNVLQKKQPPAFQNFFDYRQFLSHGLAKLVSNANSSGRVMRFSPLVSISRGYDSVACAVLAKEIGCKDAVTMFDPESPTPNADSGAEIAELLGLSVVEYSRIGYKDLAAESEFFATGTGGEDIFFAPMEQMFSQRIFISGFHGDKIWDKNPKKISDQIIRGDPSGADLEEFRLRVGFIHVAVPFFGCRAQASIAAISKSEDMAQWSVGGVYDRPICRRIAEEAGVARLSFGQKKRVMSRSFGSKGLDWYFGGRSLRDFQAYLDQRSQTWKKSDVALHWVANLYEGFASIVGKFSYRLGDKLRKVARPLQRYQRPLDATRKIFHWSFTEMLHKYHVALVEHRGLPLSERRTAANEKVHENVEVMPDLASAASINLRR